MEARFHLAAFRTTTAAMAAESRVRREGITAAVMPTPQAVVASCGLSLRFSPAVSKQVEALLEAELDRNLYQIYAAVQANGRMTFYPLPDCDA